MRRLASLLAGGSLALLTLAVAAGAVAAGGGCHARPAAASGPGADVAIAGCAFGPHILHVAPGSDVTWRNDDVGTHAVTGVGWGSVEELEQGDTATYRFNEPGIYPYQCYLHPGMTGAVVVDATAGAGGVQAAAGSPVPPTAPADAAASRPTDARPADTTAASLGLAGGAAAGGLLIGLLIGRRRPGAT